MKRHTLRTVFLACGLLAATSPVFAQAAQSEQNPPNWVAGSTQLTLMTHEDVASSKFQEYTTIPKGLALTSFSLAGSQNGKTFSIFGSDAGLPDQRYKARASMGWFGVALDYNRITHDMGNDGTSILNETAPGVWSMAQNLRTALQTAVDGTTTANRTYAFYSNLYAPVIAAANHVDVVSERQQTRLDMDLAKGLPFDAKVSYFRDEKTGSRGSGGGGYVRGAVDNLIEVLEPLNEVTQDVGFRLAMNNKSWGNVYGGFRHNWYNERQDYTILDNPLRPFDLAYTSASVPGGGSQARFISPPDNAANYGNFGALFKFAKQTRIGFEATFGQWTQNAQLYPYTINTVILTGVQTNANAPSGSRADQLSSLQYQSLNGKIDTTALNFSFTSRPITGLGVRIRYRSFDQNNKTAAIQRLGYVSLDRSWSTFSFTSEPLGDATADPYGFKNNTLEASVNYDIKAITVEAGYRHYVIDHTYRDVEKNTDSAYVLAASYKANDLMTIRASLDKGSRKATGADVTATLDLQADQAARDTTRGTIDFELSPINKVTFVVAYQRKYDKYKNPDQVSGVANTAQGLLDAKYDEYTAEVNLMPSDRAQLTFYYTHEKNLSETQMFSGGTNLISRLTFSGSDKTDTFGLNGQVQIVPDKAKLKVHVTRQKLDGLMAVAGDPTGSFALARASLGGIANVNDYGDTEYTMANVDLEYTVNKTWGAGFGYTYYKYNYLDAFSEGTLVFPQSGAGFYLKANDGAYKANVVYTYLNYRW